MRKSILGAAVVITLALAGCTAAEPEAPATNAPTGDPILIGMDLDSTSPGTSLVFPLAGQGAQAAVDELNANGGVLGRPVELVEASSESDPARGPATYQSLIEQGAVAIIGLATASVAVQAKPIIQEAKVVTIVPIAVLPTLTDQPDGDYVYSLVNTVADYGNVFCSAFKDQKVKTIGYLSDDSPAIQSLSPVLHAAFEKCGVKIVADELASVSATDLVAQATRIKEADPDAIFVQSVGGQFEALAHSALYQAMPDVPRYTQGSFGSQTDAWALATPGSLNGLVFMGPLDLSNPLTEKLSKQLSETYGADFKMSYFAAQGYDGIMLLAKAIEGAGGTDDLEAIKTSMDSISGYLPHLGQEGFTVSYSAEKHVGADGLCGLALFQFGEDNTPSGKWDVFQPPC